MAVGTLPGGLCSAMLTCIPPQVGNVRRQVGYVEDRTMCSHAEMIPGL